MKKSLSSATLRRMTTYLAYLRSISERLPQYVSATMIASALHLGDVQVRKDLAKAAGPGHTKIDPCGQFWWARRIFCPGW